MRKFKFFEWIGCNPLYMHVVAMVAIVVLVLGGIIAGIRLWEHHQAAAVQNRYTAYNDCMQSHYQQHGALRLQDMEYCEHAL